MRVIGLAIAGLFTLSMLLPGSLVAEVKDAGRCGKPPPPKSAQRSGSEGVPPLPLPAVPLRRTEKKKPPTPPTVVVKINTGDMNDWATDENDINNLLMWMQSRLKINFSYESRPLSRVKLDAARLPMLYRTGHNGFEFSPAERKGLRRYILGGGFMYFDACCGRKAFTDSARRELALIFPEKRLRKLPPDHPLYHCYYEVPKVRYSKAVGIDHETLPPLEGIDVGCRTAVVFSPYDLSCGWDMHTHGACKGVQATYALRLGANMIAYATATKSMGVSLAESRVYVDKDTSKADKFRVAQIIHDGQWNPVPAGLSTLLDTVGADTSMQVSFESQPMKLNDVKLSSFPFLYMTGHDTFHLTEGEITSLRNYLRMGGFLLSNSCCGRQAFDKAFRDLMAQVFPNHKLTPLPPTHPLYSSQYNIRTVNYTQAALVRKKLSNPAVPALEGITVDGHLAVVYSPFALGTGWGLKPNPYSIGYEAQDAIKLGVNTVVYTLMH